MPRYRPEIFRPSRVPRQAFYRNTLPPGRGGGGAPSPSAKFSRTHVFRAGFLFCGLGAGARGFVEERASLGKHRGRFLNVGGVDIDADACVDFRALSEGEALVYDLSNVGKETIGKIRALMGENSPHVIFLSPPCTGYSKLLPSAMSRTKKYQDFNMLVLKGLHLVCETWAVPPGFIVLENVPGIKHRGAEILAKARQLLSSYGYVFHEATHDCGEIGNLAQHRKRYLLVARQPGLVEDYAYLPPRHRVRACGEVLGSLPLPGDPEAGPLHKLPALSWLNWLRLALIPEGGDWRDLPTSKPVDEQARKEWLQHGKKAEGQPNLYKGKHGVMSWGKPARAVIGGPSNGASNVSQPLDVSFGAELQKGSYGVVAWTGPAGTVTGEAYPSNGRFSAADPLPEDVALGHAPRNQSYSVCAWAEPFGTVRGVARASNGAAAVAQPLEAAPLLVWSWAIYPHEATWLMPLPSPGPEAAEALAALGSDNPGRHHNKYAVTPWTAPARTVTGGDGRIGSGAPSVADERVAADVALGHEPRDGSMGVLSWNAPASPVTGSMRVSQSNTASSVAQPLPDAVGLGHEPRPGAMGVLDWEAPAAAITGSMVSVGQSNTPSSVAQPLPEGVERHFTDETRGGANGVIAWGRPAPTITGTMHVRGNTPASVADERVAALTSSRSTRFSDQYRTLRWGMPATTVTGSTDIQEGAPSVADVLPEELISMVEPQGSGKSRKKAAAARAPAPSADVCVLELGLTSPVREGQARREVMGRYDLRPWNEPAHTVAGSGTNGGYGVADPRVQEVASALAQVAPKGAKYVVMSWEQVAYLLTSGLVDPKDKPDFIPVILSKHGRKWNRPLTTLELAALQGLPERLKGKPLSLCGKAVAGWRRRIGNAVPVGAARAIANSLLRALIASKTGEYQLGEAGRWVKRRDARRKFAPTMIRPKPPPWAQQHSSQSLPI